METLPPEVELEKVEATYRNGVLEIHLPRKAVVGRRVTAPSWRRRGRLPTR